MRRILAISILLLSLLSCSRRLGAIRTGDLLLLWKIPRRDAIRFFEKDKATDWRKMEIHVTTAL